MIGRELYTAPFIWIKAEDTKISPGNNGKFSCADGFIVEKITYDENGNIDGLAINSKSKGRVFTKAPVKNQKNS